MNSTVGLMFTTAAAVLLPLHPAFSALAVQGAQQDVSLEGRIAQLQQRIDEDPKDPELHFELSKLYEENVERYYDDALSEFKVAIKRGLKGNTVIWNDLGALAYNKGMEFFDEGKYNEAIEKWEDARRWNPNDFDIYTNIAAAYRGKGGLSKGDESKEYYNEAIKYMKIAVDLDPANDARYQMLGSLYVERGVGNGDFMLGLLNANKTLHLNPKNERIYFVLGWAQQNLGQYDEAIKAYKKHLKYNDSERAEGLIKECKRLTK